MIIRVKVGEATVEVTAQEVSKNLWVASGTHLGRTYVGEGKTSKAAAADVQQQTGSVTE